MIFIVSGCIGCLFSGFILSLKPMFKALAIGTALLHFLAYVAFVITLNFYQSRIVTGMQMGLIGFVNLAA